MEEFSLLDNKGEVQRVRVPDSDRVTWMVLDEGYLPIAPIQLFLRYLDNIERSPNTIRSYAYHLKLYWEYLRDIKLDWKNVGLSELADFIAWLRNPLTGVLPLHPQEAKRTETTVNTIITAVCTFYDYHERADTVEALPLYRSQVQLGRAYKGFLHHLSRNKPVRNR